MTLTVQCLLHLVLILCCAITLIGATIGPSDVKRPSKSFQVNLGFLFISLFLTFVLFQPIEANSPVNESVFDRSLVITSAKPKDILREHKSYSVSQQEQRDFNGTVLAYVTPVS